MTVAKLIQAYITKKRQEAKTGTPSDVSTGKLQPAQLGSKSDAPKQ
jgi:hypothetical protein